ncbi:hypothetical protein ACHAXN_003578 [Cyclotella atomus]
MAKADTNNKQRIAIDSRHKIERPTISLGQRSKNIGYSIGSSFKRAINNLSPVKQVRFAKKHRVQEFHTEEVAAWITYDSGADFNYMAERDRVAAGLPALKRSNKRVKVANGAVSNATNVTLLPFEQLSNKARTADTFTDFPNSLMSVGVTSDDGCISIFDKHGVTVHKEEDVLITCKGEPILIGVRDENGRYRIPLMQQRGRWQPRQPKKRVSEKLRQANSVYDLPSVEQAIKWMHAVCGFPVKSTWIKAVKAGNFVGWPLLTEKNIAKYYPETDETPKGHMNQTRKNVRSTKAKKQPLEVCNMAASLKGQKVQDVFVKTYDVRETIFSDQTGKFPTQSQRGNKYIMVMVEIDSNAILVEPMRSRNDGEMIRAYDVLVKRLKNAGVHPKKHVLDNEISENMKQHIREQYKFTLEMVPPGCHRRNAAEVAIRNFKAHFLSVLAGTADNFPKNLWDRLLPQTEITLNLLRQSNATPTVSAYAHLCGPFDYNKMPLAPMGCEVQVHEKTDKRGTWAYHSVDGWYLYTSPEHYRVHNCQIKQTKKERLSDTVQFKHKHITNPTLTPTDKLMNALANCKAALEGKLNEHPNEQLQQLRKLVDSLEPVTKKKQAATQNDAPAPSKEPTTAPHTSRVPSLASSRVNSNDATSSRVRNETRETILNSTSYLTRARANEQRTRARKRRSLAHLTSPINFPQAPPAKSTRSHTSELRQSTRLRQQTKASEAKLRQANAVMQLQRGSFKHQMKALHKLHVEVEQAMAVLDKDSGKLLNYRQLLVHPKYKKDWSVSSANEFGRLAQGVGGRIKGTNTIFFIHESEIPKERRKDVTYGSFVCTVRPEKAEPNRTRFTAGGDKINYPFEVATPTAEMLVAKILFNSVISTPGARFMTMDISNFYLMTPLKRPEFIRIRLSEVPEEIIQEYNLRAKVNAKGMIHMKVVRGMRRAYWQMSC